METFELRFLKLRMKPAEIIGAFTLEGMESLAFLIVIILMVIVLGGPVAILLTLIKTKNIYLTLLRRLIQAVVIILSVGASVSLLSTNVYPLAIFGLAMAYIALAREYFPRRRFISTFIKRIIGRGLSKDSSA